MIYRLTIPIIVLALLIGSISALAPFVPPTSALESPTSPPDLAQLAVPFTRAAPASPQGRIAFVSQRDGNNEIYTMRPDGSDVIRLTNNKADDLFPVWSPDGTAILFTSNRDGNLDIFVMGATGLAPHNLTQNAARDRLGRWSPNGSEIVFQSDRDGNDDIFIMSADGRGTPTQLTTNRAGDFAPAWSPNGQSIAFISDRDGMYEIYSMTREGGVAVRLTKNQSGSIYPAWSPDGQKIAFQSFNGRASDIYVMNVLGGDIVRLTTSPAQDGEPVWSPDGTQIVFYSNRDGNDNIYVMNADGSGQHRVTSSKAVDGTPSWSGTVRNTLNPATGRLVVASDRNIYTINANGSGRAQVTNHPRPIMLGNRVEVSPDGQRIVYTGTCLPPDAGVKFCAYVVDTTGGKSTNLHQVPLNDQICWTPDGQHVAILVDATRAPTPNKSGYATIISDIHGSAAKMFPQAGQDFAWSPDGKRIAFTPAIQEGDIFLMNADGSQVMQLTNAALTANQDGIWFAHRPRWSPDGKWIIYSAIDGIYRIDVRGGSAIRLFGHSAYFLEWSPDGKRIAFDSLDGIYVMNADGGQLTHLGDGVHPLWSPDGHSLAFMRLGDIYTMRDDGSNLIRITTGAGYHTVAWLPTQSYPTVELLEATVFNGGNVRAQPSIKERVLDQIHAGERVRLLAKTRNGAWYQILNARNVTGWVSATLLTLDTATIKQVSIAE